MRQRQRFLVFTFTAILVLSLASFHEPVEAESSRPRVDLKCVAFGTGPMLECLVTVQRRDGTPLDNIQMTLGALMPSMPMAHTIKPVKAAPTGKPGEYKGTLELEMSGVWTVDMDLSGPVRDKVARNLQVEECAGNARCAVAPAVAGSAAGNAHKGHGNTGHSSGKH